MIGVPRKSVVLNKYCDSWSSYFETEKALILEVTGDNIEKIEHVGSTAVKGLVAKPIIDIAGVYSGHDKKVAIVEAMKSIGYEYSENNGIINRLYFSKRIDGKSYYHLHFYLFGSKDYDKQIFFRDYLRSNQDVAFEYSKLKQELLMKYQDDRPKYTEGKSDFILRVLKEREKITTDENLMVVEINEINSVYDFVKRLSNNNQTASYPKIHDEETLLRVLNTSVSREDYRLIGCYENESLVGVVAYFWEDKDKYIQTTLFLVERNYSLVATKMIDYISNHLKGYKAFIGFQKGNQLAISYFKEEMKAECIEDSVVTSIKGFTNYNMQYDMPLEQVTKENFSTYSKFHDIFAKEYGIYYDSVNLLSDLEEFAILGIKEQGEFIASIFFKTDKKISTVYGLFVSKEYKDQGQEALLIDGMLDYLSSSFEAVGEVIYFIDRVEADELKAALELGFKIKEEYLCFCI